MDESASVFLELTTEAIAEELYQLAHELDQVKFYFFLWRCACPFTNTFRLTP